MIFKKVSLLRAILKSNPDIAVDFLFADDEFKKQMVQHGSVISITGFPVRIPTPEDLIILKLLSDRPQDRIDVARIRANQENELNAGYIEEWCDKPGIPLD